MSENSGNIQVLGGGIADEEEPLQRGADCFRWRQAELGTPVAKVMRKMGVKEPKI